MSPTDALGFHGRDTADFPWSRRRVTPTMGRGGAVCAGHPLAASAGQQVLRNGGNAVDAAVATGLVASVVMPEMCGLGGDLFAVVHAPAREELPSRTESVQGSGAAPRAVTLERMRAAGDGHRMPDRGPLSVSVPGMVDAYATLLERYGSRSFAELVEPAVAYAEGHPVSAFGLVYVERFADLLRRNASAREVFLPGGAVPGPGEIRRQADLARTLQALARDGVRDFYEGAIAERICAATLAEGGLLGLEDMAAHRTDVSEPLSTTYRDHTIHQTRLPSQGLIVLEALKIAEQFDLSTDVAPEERIHVLVEAVKLAFADRVAHCLDPAYGESPVETLLSPEWAKSRAAEIAKTANQDVTGGEINDGDTSYLCAVDDSGMMVSLIQSVAANFGSGLVAGDTGVVMNNRASQFSLDPRNPNVIAPGKKTVHTLNCYLVSEPNGRPVLVGGTPGGDRQPQWNTQVLSGLIDGGWDAQQSIEQPLWVSQPSAPGDDGYTLNIEGRVGDHIVAGLSARGHRVDRLADWGCESVHQVVGRDAGTGVLVAGSDPRGEGQAVVH